MDDNKLNEQPAVTPANDPSAAKKMHTKKVLIFVLITIALLSAVVLITRAQNKRSGMKIPETSKPAKITTAAEVNISPTGFSPSTIRIKKNQSVNWTNRDDQTHQIAADPHPTHTSLPELFSDPMTKEETYSYTFQKSGTFTYHDEINPLKFKGTVVVE